MIIPRHTGHAASISATRIAQFSQNRACPHGTNANLSRGAIRHTSQNCDSVTADADDVVAVAVGAGTVGVWASSNSSLLLLLSFWSLLIAVSLLPQCPLPRFQRPRTDGWPHPLLVAKQQRAWRMLCLMLIKAISTAILRQWCCCCCCCCWWWWWYAKSIGLCLHRRSSMAMQLMHLDLPVIIIYCTPGKIIITRACRVISRTMKSRSLSYPTFDQFEKILSVYWTPA